MNTAQTLSLADFEAWLKTTQQRALDGMHATQGEAFALHSSDFSMLSTAANVVHQFKLGTTNTNTSGRA